ncbi:MAG: ribonuclease catalytic domain-containing protein [Desulforegulaceae bacterium]|nr:ribonuclease catalytic domain-containing protein [Desulforegulaceae bacterium]
MNEGQVVEYIDDQKILSAAVLEIKKNRLRILNENNREVNISQKRISLSSEKRIPLKQSRENISKILKDFSAESEKNSKEVDIESLWEILNTESDWIDVDSVSELWFGDNPEPFQKSALMRAMFYDRLYFKFNHSQYLPFTPEQVEQLKIQKQEEERKKNIIKKGGSWLKKNMNMQNPEMPTEELDLINILSSYYLLENESNQSELAREIFKEAGTEPGLKVFKLFTRLGVWDNDENTDLLKYDLERNFSNNIIESVKNLEKETLDLDLSKRKDLTGLKIFTIDGKNTKDFDDALSFEEKNEKLTAGVHITDVAFSIKKDTPIDRNAMLRASSIYMPDEKIPMLHPSISEKKSSLIKGETRPAISVLIEFTEDFSISDFKIVPSIIKVSEQITYDEADELINSSNSNELSKLYELAKKLRETRFLSHAVHISIPDTDVYVDENKNIEIKVLDRETPSWLLVSEFMIIANHLMAEFLKSNSIPAIFRGQPKPETRYYEGDNGDLLMQFLQRKEMSRVIISTTPEPHFGLGVNSYITSTSPVRKYFDLVCQRQIKSVFGLETPYSTEELDEITARLDNTMSSIGRVQFQRKRYWILKYLEEKRGEKEPALVISDKRFNSYSIVLLNYMMDSKLPATSGMNLKPGDNIVVIIQNVNARSDILSVHLS